MSKLHGRKVAIGKRSVFVGQWVSEPGTFFIQFINLEGDKTRLRISQEAAIALARLINGDEIGDKLDFEMTVTGESKTHWVHVRDPEHQA